MKRRPDPELAALRAQADRLKTIEATLISKLTQAQGNYAYAAHERDGLKVRLAEAQAEVCRQADLVSELNDNADVFTVWREQLTGSLERVIGQRDEARAELEPLRRKVLDLMVELADARETDPTGRKLADYRARADRAEKQAAKARAEVIRIAANQRHRIDQAIADMRAELAKADRAIADRETAITKLRRDAHTPLEIVRPAGQTIGGAW